MHENRQGEQEGEEVKDIQKLANEIKKHINIGFDYSNGKDKTALAFFDADAEMIVEALEKQIAKKPIELPEEETFYDGGYYGHKCGMCEFPVYDDQIYCDKCGQKIDWGNDE